MNARQSGDEVHPLFVVGYSRSGTKFVCNLLERSSAGRIAHVGELHFFGRLATSSEEEVRNGQVTSLLRKMAQQYLRRKNCPYSSVEEVMQLFSTAERDLVVRTKADVLSHFFAVIGQDLGVDLICDGTPRNAYYIGDILRSFPSAKILYMLRDPRDSILSQKKKAGQVWKRGDRREATRLALNYNPVVMAKFWLSSLRTLEQFDTNERLAVIRYEDMLADPATVLLNLSAFVGCEGMEKSAGDVLQGNTGKFESGLTTGEIAAIEAVAGRQMGRYGYECASPGWLGAVFATLWMLRFMLTVPFTYLFNLGRFRNILHEARKRIFR